MSLFILIFYYVVIPLVLLGATASLMQKTDRPTLKATVLVIGAGLGLGLFWLAFGRVWWVDYQVRKMCARDGGIKIYKTVKLPANQFNPAGQPVIFSKEHTKPSDKYYSYSTKKYLNLNQPKIRQIDFKVFRREDEKLLGEVSIFQRGGGGLPGPWAESSYTCPKKAEAELLSKIFSIE